MALYCANGEGGFYEINNYDALITELAKTDTVKALYQDTKASFEILKAIKSLLDDGVIEHVDEEAADDEFAMLPDVEASVAKFRASVVELYGEDVAKELDTKVQDAFDNAKAGLKAK